MPGPACAWLWPWASVSETSGRCGASLLSRSGPSGLLSPALAPASLVLGFLSDPGWPVHARPLSWAHLTLRLGKTLQDPAPPDRVAPPLRPVGAAPCGRGRGGASCRPLPPAAGEKRARALMLSCPFHLTGAPVFPWSPCFSKAREVGCWRCSHPSFAFSFSFPCCGGFWFPPEGSGRISPHCDISSSL